MILCIARRLSSVVRRPPLVVYYSSSPVVRPRDRDLLYSTVQIIVLVISDNPDPDRGDLRTPFSGHGLTYSHQTRSRSSSYGVNLV